MNRLRILAIGGTLAVATAFIGGRLRHPSGSGAKWAPPTPGAGGRRPVSELRASSRAVGLIKRSEGLVLRPYSDAGGCSIGYGHRIKDGTCLTAPLGLQNGISQEEALDLLRQDVATVEAGIRRHVKVPLTQGEFDALVDWGFQFNANRLAGTTLLRHLNAGRYEDAGEELPKWVHAEGRVSPGIVARREAALAIWRS